MRYLFLILALVSVAACDAGPGSGVASAQAAEPFQRPDFTLADADGQMRSVEEWDGKVLVVNFWATWCPPCRREMPTFIELQKEYGPRGLQFIGLALDEADKVRDFRKKMGVNYPLLVGDDPVYDAASAYGDTSGVLPYSAIVDRKGQVVYTHAGELTREQAEAIILPLL